MRHAAIHCIQVSLRVGACEKGEWVVCCVLCGVCVYSATTSGKADKMVDALSVLKQRATADDPTALFTLVSDLGKVGKEMGGAGRGSASQHT